MAASTIQSHATSNVICDMTINRSSLFWVVRQRTLVGVYRRFGTTYRPHRQGSGSPRRMSGTGGRVVILGWSELRNNSEVRKSHLHRGESLKFRVTINTLKTNIHLSYLKTSVSTSERRTCVRYKHHPLNGG
jgi:hypothetical protein